MSLDELTDEAQSSDLDLSASNSDSISSSNHSGPDDGLLDDAALATTTAVYHPPCLPLLPLPPSPPLAFT